jgi:hypothetical protein
MVKVEVTAGIDIGGTNTALGFVDREGSMHLDLSIPTNAHEGPDVFINRLSTTLREMIGRTSDRCVLKGIGIGAPNANYYRGTVEFAPNLGWKGVVNVVEMLKRDHHLPIAMTNDANAAALGEMIFGAAKGMKDFIVITLGTGLGSGIVCSCTAQMDSPARSVTWLLIPTGGNVVVAARAVLKPTRLQQVSVARYRNCCAKYEVKAYCAISVHRT